MVWANLTPKQALVEIQETGLLGGYDPGTIAADSLLTIVTNAYLLSPRRLDYRRADRAMVFTGPPTEPELLRMLGLFDPSPLTGVSLYRGETIDDFGRRIRFERIMARTHDDHPVSFDYRTFVEVERFINRLLAEMDHPDRLYALHESEVYDSFVVLALTPQQAAVLHRYHLLEVGDHRAN
ncbi:MAG: hypothetical protein AB7P03_11700 [Kofleriaceae bacterium]